MKREIKFRAWNKEIKTMGSALPLKVWTDDIATDIGREKYLRDKDNIILMQFTGLKDKNGKEIYEGDIVKWLTIKKEKVGKIEWNESWAGFTIEPDHDKNLHGLEVIGNIYENPELLK